MAREHMSRQLSFVVVVFVALGLSACASSAQIDALRAQNAELRREIDALKKKRAQHGKAAEGEGAAASERKTAAVDWSKFPVGSMWIGWGNKASLGWADLRVRSVRACKPGVIGIELEIRNGTDRPIYRHKIKDAATVATSDGAGTLAQTMSFEKKCQSRVHQIAPQSAGKIWLAYEGTVSRAERLEIDLAHPSGLSTHHLVFGLAKGLKPPKLATQGRAFATRPEPPKDRIGEPVETPHFRLTVVNKKLCVPNLIHGQASLGVEVVFENFTNVALAVRESGKLRDEDGREYKNNRMGYVGGCAPRIDSQEVKPGERARGWLFPFMLEPTDKTLTLVYAVNPAMGTGLHGRTTIHTAIGSFPQPDPELKSPTSWNKPKVAHASGSNYSITVTNVQPCNGVIENDKIWLGVELLIENRSTMPMVIPHDFTVKDEANYAYKKRNVAFEDSSPCQPTLGYDPIKPGTKRRGWVRAFRVPATAGSLRLEQTIAWERHPNVRAPVPPEQDVTLPIGQLTD